MYITLFGDFTMFDETHMDILEFVRANNFLSIIDFILDIHTFLLMGTIVENHLGRRFGLPTFPNIFVCPNVLRENWR